LHSRQVSVVRTFACLRTAHQEIGSHQQGSARFCAFWASALGRGMRVILYHPWSPWTASYRYIFSHFLLFLFSVNLFPLQSTPTKKSLSPSTGKDSAATAAASTALSLSPIIQAKTVAADAKLGKAEFSQFTPSPRVARASSSSSAASKAVELNNKSSAAKQHTASAHAANKSKPTPAAAFVATAERESSEHESPSAIDSLQIEASPSAPQLGDAPSADCFEHGFEHRTVASAASSASAAAPTAFVSLLDRPAARASAPMSATPSFDYAPALAPASASASLFYPTASASVVASFQPQQQQQEQNTQANADIAEMLHRLNERMEEVRERIMLGSSHKLLTSLLRIHVFSHVRNSHRAQLVHSHWCRCR
jgi:hypothetical protein